MTQSKKMSGHDLRVARERLGAAWGLDRPCFASELGRALGNPARDPGELIRDYERKGGAPVPWLLDIAVTMMLRGAMPPAGVPRDLTK